MKACPEYKKILWLDAYGELDRQERSAWEKHLETCKACRAEKKRLLGLLQAVRTALPLPSLSPESADTLAVSVERELKNKPYHKWWIKRFFNMPDRMIPVFGTACLIIIVTGWFSFKEFRNAASVQNSAERISDEEIISKDLDILTNLEILEEMEALEQLVNFLDRSDNYDSPINREGRIDYVRAHV